MLKKDTPFTIVTLFSETVRLFPKLTEYEYALLPVGTDPFAKATLIYPIKFDSWTRASVLTRSKDTINDSVVKSLTMTCLNCGLTKLL